MVNSAVWSDVIGVVGKGVPFLLVSSSPWGGRWSGAGCRCSAGRSRCGSSVSLLGDYPIGIQSVSGSGSITIPLSSIYCFSIIEPIASCKSSNVVYILGIDTLVPGLGCSHDSPIILLPA